MTSSLVGSEMCIRDSLLGEAHCRHYRRKPSPAVMAGSARPERHSLQVGPCRQWRFLARPHCQ
eukprot:10563246-Prorocentrum_lima.AAC.1